jgi:hypothetical protein
MGFLGICSDDFLVQTLRQTFGANPIRVPEERILPLTVLASDGKRTTFRSKSPSSLLKGNPSIDVETSTSKMVNLSGKRSRSVKLDLGLKVLDGFLSGMGIPSAKVTAKFEGAREISFSFQDVQRLFVDPGVLGAELAGTAINDASPAAAIFLEPQYQFLIVDSVIQSRDFNIKVESSASNAFSLDVPAIQEIVGNAKLGVEVSSGSSLELTFKAKKHLSFAFSCLRLYVDGNGSVTSMPPAGNVPGLAAALGVGGAGTPTRTLYMPDRVLLSSEPGLVEIEGEIEG